MIEVKDNCIADLHVHSNNSWDGKEKPKRIIKSAEGKLKYLLFADHGSITYDDLIYFAERKGIILIPGIEISTSNFANCHLVGAGIKKRTELNAYFKKLTTENEENMNKMVDILRLEHGIKLDQDRIDELSIEGVLRRSNIAREIIKAGYAKDINEAYEKYVGPNGVAYIETKKPSVREGSRLIRNSGGVPILVHPWLLRDRSTWKRPSMRQFEDSLESFIDMGVQGLECSADSQSGKNYYRGLAKESKLIVTGGSDFHDTSKGKKLGSEIITESEMDELFQKIRDNNSYGIDN